MPTFGSTLSRILLLHGIALLVVSVVLPLTLYELIRNTSRDLHDQLMIQQAVTIGEYVVPSGGPDGNSEWVLDLPLPLRRQYSTAYGRERFSIQDVNGQVLFSSLIPVRSVFPWTGPEQSPRYVEADAGSSKVQGVSLPVVKGDQTIWVQVAEDLTHRDVLMDDLVALFLPRVGWVVVPFLLLLLILDVLIFRRALRPIEAASAQAAQIAPKTVDVRLDLADIPSEIRPLVTAVNQALERLEVGFRLQREFAADAAHELRTPLSLLRARVETLEPSEATRALRQDIDSMSRVVAQLLQIAELDHAHLGDEERADLHDVGLEVVAMLAPLAIAARKEIGLVGHDGPISVHGNGEMIFRAVRNLAENALSHTPEGTAVDIEIYADGRVVVSDHGPGIPEEERALVVRRFWRRDRARNGNSGLGLAIVYRIAEIHAADMTISDNNPSGTRIELAFRAAGQA